MLQMLFFAFQINTKPHGFLWLIVHNKIFDTDLDGLKNELEIVIRELKNSVNLLDKKRKKLRRQRTAYIVFFCILWIAIYFYYSRGLIRK